MKRSVLEACMARATAKWNWPVVILSMYVAVMSINEWKTTEFCGLRQQSFLFLSSLCVFIHDEVGECL